MTTEDATDTPTDEREPLSSVFLHMDFDQVKVVVNRALGFRGQASESVRSALASSIRRSVRIDGFRDASRALPQQITEPVMWEILQERDDGLAGAILRAWAESHASLHDIVVGHLEGLGISAEYPDLKANRFNSVWLRDEWLNQCDAIVKDHADLDRDDVALMLCYVSGRIPDLPHHDQEEHRTGSPLFLEWLDELRELPPDAPEWANLSDFVAALAEIAAGKSAARIDIQVEALDHAVSEIVENFGDELRYLDVDLRSWSEEAAARPAVISDTLELVGELKDELIEYRPIHPQAPSRSDELRRADERREREEAILGIIAKWERLMDGAESPDDDPAPPQGALESEQETGDPSPAQEPDDDAAAAPSTSAGDEGADTHQTTPMAENDVLKLELDRLRSQGQSHESENARLRQENAGLQSDKTVLDGENSGLRHELSLSREAEESWRRAYISVSARQADSTQDELVPLLNANDAVALAERTFPDELLFCLNSKSDKASPFRKPEELFDALAWLATAYRRLRTNPGASPDFNVLVKEACPGWSYRPDQAGVTKGQFAEWYTGTANGKTYELNSHIGKGNSFDPQNTIRVAFAWDDDLRKVIVGYIGLHQRTRRS